MKKIFLCDIIHKDVAYYIVYMYNKTNKTNKTIVLVYRKMLTRQLEVIHYEMGDFWFFLSKKQFYRGMLT